jgi:hypothetical protein
MRSSTVEMFHRLNCSFHDIINIFIETSCFNYLNQNFNDTLTAVAQSGFCLPIVVIGPTQIPL